ncbi:MAG TPA: YafY family protein [Chloroflexia bacterium]|nr:YafY family protein [Chloroflexia bacterium]
MANTATRLITLIMLLQRRPNQTARQLAQELEVSPRTVQRYMAMLDEIGIPIYAERGPYGGYALVRGYKMPPLIFTPEEAVALYLGTAFTEQVWARLYREAARSAIAKLDNVLPDEQRREVAWAQRTLHAVGVQWGDPALSAPHLEKLWDAVRAGRTVRMSYLGRGHQAPTERRFDPYTLVHSWGWHYTIGYCHLRRGIRTFRLDRIVELEVLDDTFDPPTGFNLEAYVAAEPFFHPSLHARLRFGPHAAHQALNNRAFWDTLEEHPDGSITATFAAHDLEGAAGIVLRYGYLADVLEPSELRDIVLARARAIVERYAPSNRPEQAPE